MSEVTIDIPAEHVGELRDLMRYELCVTGEELGGYQPPPARIKAKLAEIHAYEQMLDQLGWEDAESPDTALSGDKRRLRRFLQHAFEYASEGIDATNRQAARSEIARAAWLSDTLDSLEPKGVAA